MLSWFYELITAFASVLTSVLPLSPFQQYIKAFAGLPYLGILNWFIPIGAFVKIGAAWLGGKFGASITPNFCNNSRKPL